MEFKIEELVDESQNYIEITGNKECLNNVKAFTNDNKIKIDFNSLMLSTCLYGSTKKESLEIQKKNCKLMLKFYKVVEKAVKFLKKQGIGTQNLIFVLRFRLNRPERPRQTEKRLS